MWDGDEWYPLGEGVTGGDLYNYTVSSIAIKNNDVYVGGAFTQAGGKAIKYIAKWDGTKWSSLGNLEFNGNDKLQVRSIVVKDEYIYAGGYFKNIGSNNVNSVARWNGISWEAMNDGIKYYESNGLIVNMLFRENNLYVCGYFDHAGSVAAKTVASWNGNQWQALDNSNPLPYYASAMTDDGKNLYIALTDGMFYRGIAKWDGNTWSVFNNILEGASGGYTAIVNSLAIYKNSLIAGGYIESTVNSTKVILNGIAKYDDKWLPLGSGVEGHSNLNYGSYPIMPLHGVYSLAVCDSDLYVGGYFNFAGNKKCDYLARYSSSFFPDLIVLQPKCSQLKIKIGDDTEFSCKIKNQGRENSQTGYLKIFLSANSNFTIDADVLLDSIFYEILSPNVLLEIKKSIKLESRLTNGTHFIKFVVDSKNSTIETSENNNIDILPINIMNSENSFISYSFSQQIKSANIDNINHTINIEVDAKTDIAKLIATFELSKNATANLNGVEQISGQSINDFSNTVIYQIIAEDGTKQDWLITVTKTQTNIESVFEKDIFKSVITNNQITIENTSITKYSISVYDIQGKLLLNFQNVSKQIIIDITNLKSGVYTLKFETPRYVETKKFVKE